ncbi:MAG: hypothetical protein JWN53_221 [Gemmatimonadetes bacterium]|nr:hypothetical protein [Gemmatimonadota bacterium]
MTAPPEGVMRESAMPGCVPRYALINSAGVR